MMYYHVMVKHIAKLVVPTGTGRLLTLDEAARHAGRYLDRNLPLTRWQRGAMRQWFERRGVRPADSRSPVVYWENQVEIARTHSLSPGNHTTGECRSRANSRGHVTRRRNLLDNDEL